MTQPAPVLAVETLTAGYEPDAPIVEGVSLTAARGEIVAVLGPNGAGKSTLIKSIAGLVPVTAGRVRLDGRDITALPAHAMVRQGVALVPQTENVFATLTVDDNLKIAAAVLPRTERAARIAEVCGLFPDLRTRRRLAAGRLSGGQRQMLAMARALLAQPKLLLLDEPSAGLSPKMVDQVFRKLADIRLTGVSIVLVEQNVRAALAIADRLYLLVAGRNRLEGSTAAVLDDPAIAALYLGGAGRASSAAGAPSFGAPPAAAAPSAGGAES